MQWKRIGVIALSVVLVAGPASAIPVTDPAAIAQRITMMTNQVTIITNQLTQIQQFTDKLNTMTEQIDHLKEKALGSYHALTEPFNSLISAKTKLVGQGMGWIGEFKGQAAQVAGTYKQLSDGVSIQGGWDSLLQSADTVSESDILDLFAHRPAEVGQRAAEHFRQEREAADRQRVLDHTLADASARLIESLKLAQDALDGVRNQTQKSDTALAQANIAATATMTELLAGLAQLQATQSAREAGKSYQRELSRRQNQARWAEHFRKSKKFMDDREVEINALPDTGGKEIKFPAFSF